MDRFENITYNLRIGAHETFENWNLKLKNIEKNKNLRGWHSQDFDDDGITIMPYLTKCGLILELWSEMNCFVNL